MALQVPKGFHGRLIGSGFSTAKQIQEKCGCQLTFPDRDSSSCEILVSGGDINAVAAEFEQILGFKVSAEPIVTLSLNIDSSEFGKLIGRGGSTMRSLTESNSVHIDIPRGGDGPVEVQGSNANVQAAKAAIEEILGHPVGSGALEVAKDDFERYPLTGRITEALFFPDDSGKSHDRFLGYLKSATKTLDICVFTLTDNRIVRILLAHHAHGVQIRLLTDNDTSEARGSDIDELRENGIPTAMDTSPAHMHHKFAVLDGKCLLSGSFNWTVGAAKENCENIMILNEPTLVGLYKGEFEKLWSKYYSG